METRKYIYCDNAATTFPKPPEVLDAVMDFMRDMGASPGRSSHRLAIAASRIVFDARDKLATLFNAPDSSRIVFTSNATQGINTALQGLVKTGDRVITTSMEHNSVMRPLRWLEKTRGVVVDIAQSLPTGELDLDALEAACRRPAKLLVINHGSNVVGAIAPLARVSAVARAAGAFLLVDAAQTAGAVPIDVTAMSIDLLAFSGHKSLYGPQGTGGLYIREGVDITPLLFGGTGSNSESEEQPAFLPDAFESGTLNGPGLAGLAAGVEFILRTGIPVLMKRAREMTVRLREGLQSIPGVRIYGPSISVETLPTISITIGNIDNGTVARRFDEEFGIYTRMGLQCAPSAHRTIGTFPQGTVRISLDYFTTPEDVDRVIAAARGVADAG